MQFCLIQELIYFYNNITSQKNTLQVCTSRTSNMSSSFDVVLTDFDSISFQMKTERF